MMHARDVFSAMRKAGPLGFVIVAGFLLVIIFVIPGGKTKAAETVMRETFRVPDTARFIDIIRPHAYTAGIIVEGTVQFTPEGYSSYRKAAIDPSLWKPLTLSRNSVPVGRTHLSSLQSWQEISRSIPQSDGWNHVSEKPVYYDELGRTSAERGLILCYVIRRVKGKASRDKSTWRAEDFEVASCKDTPVEPRPSALFLGVLDDQSNTLYTKVRHAGFWPE
ncbi:hypothetical protein [Fretibacter rubidus]|uniref:hypothetical protein n=1 Tax=Fretibacter rubidus TaxID=570162 RepID=UPI00352B89DE